MLRQVGFFAFFDRSNLRLDHIAELRQTVFKRMLKGLDSIYKKRTDDQDLELIDLELAIKHCQQNLLRAARSYQIVNIKGHYGRYKGVTREKRASLHREKSRIECLLYWLRKRDTPSGWEDPLGLGWCGGLRGDKGTCELCKIIATTDARFHDRFFDNFCNLGELEHQLYRESRERNGDVSGDSTASGEGPNTGSRWS